MRRKQLVIDDTGSVEGIYVFIYWTKWRSGQVLLMPYGRTDSQTLKEWYSASYKVWELSSRNAILYQSVIRRTKGAWATTCRVVQLLKKIVLFLSIIDQFSFLKGLIPYKVGLHPKDKFSEGKWDMYPNPSQHCVLRRFCQSSKSPTLWTSSQSSLEHHRHN